MYLHHYKAKYKELYLSRSGLFNFGSHLTGALFACILGFDIPTSSFIFIGNAFYYSCFHCFFPWMVWIFLVDCRNTSVSHISWNHSIINALKFFINEGQPFVYNYIYQLFMNWLSFFHLQRMPTIYFTYSRLQVVSVTISTTWHSNVIKVYNIIIQWLNNYNHYYLLTNFITMLMIPFQCNKLFLLFSFHVLSIQMRMRNYITRDLNNKHTYANGVQFEMNLRSRWDSLLS